MCFNCFENSDLSLVKCVKSNDTCKYELFVDIDPVQKRKPCRNHSRRTHDHIYPPEAHRDSFIFLDVANYSSQNFCNVFCEYIFKYLKYIKICIFSKLIIIVVVCIKHNQ